MTTYISSLIDPVVRQARRFSRSAADPQRPEGFTAAQTPGNAQTSGSQNDESVSSQDTAMTDAPPSSSSSSSPSSLSRTQSLQNAALDRVLAGDMVGGEEDALSPMSISTPAEADLRRLDRERMQRLQEGAFASSGENADPLADNHRSRGRTDPLPRPVLQRDSAQNRRQASWRLDRAGGRSASIPTSGGQQQQQAASLPAAVGGFGFVNDPVASRSVRMSISGQSPMSIDSSTPASTTGAPAERGGAEEHVLVIPEDDGMRDMRDRIKAVQALDASMDEKSRMMHSIMTERWMSGQQASHHRDMLKEENLGRPQSPATASLRSQEAPTTPRSTHSMMDGLLGPGGILSMGSPSTSLSTEPPEEELVVTPEDLQPTYWTSSISDETNTSANVSSFGDDDLLEERGGNEEESRAFGCAHYKRNVKLQCADCHKWYTCRFCHDAEIESHRLVRNRTRNMLCMQCGTAQAAAQSCRKCQTPGASYYCERCKLWDDDGTKKIYHCDACGICRIGEGLGKDFFHCRTCDVCISTSKRETHRCIERSIDCDCPICGEYMFTSPTTVMLMRCGHGIHQSCYNLYLKRNYRCPICARSVMNMDITFRNLDLAIAAQPMPDEFRGVRALVHCNDCRSKSHTPYHWAGLKCAECDSYNTVQISLVGPDGRNQLPDPTTAAAAATLNQLPADAASAATSTTTTATTGEALTPGADSRGRIIPAGQSTASRSRRPTSTGAIQDIRPPVGSEAYYPIVSSSRSVSVIGMDRSPLGRNDSVSSALNALGGDDDDDDEDDEIDFWGGAPSPKPKSHREATNVPEEAVVEDEEEEDSSSSDEDLEGMKTDDDDDDDDFDDAEEDEIALPGHR